MAQCGNNAKAVPTSATDDVYQGNPSPTLTLTSV